MERMNERVQEIEAVIHKYMPEPEGCKDGVIRYELYS